MSKKTLIVACLVVTSLAGPAHAFFVSEEKDPPAPKPAFDLSGDRNIITQVGWGEPREVAGFGENLPLSDSLDMVIPEDWRYIVADNIDAKDINVSWQAKGSWIDALEKIGEEHNLRFLIDWDNERVLLSKADIDAPLNMEAMNIAAGGVEGGGSDVADLPAAGSEEPAIPVWELAPGSLKDQMQGWAETAGWQLVWAAPTDYRLRTNVDIEAPFVEAVSQVVESMRTNGATIRGYLYEGNKVVLIKGE